MLCAPTEHCFMGAPESMEFDWKSLDYHVNSAEMRNRWTSMEIYGMNWYTCGKTIGKWMGKIRVGSYYPYGVELERIPIFRDSFRGNFREERGLMVLPTLVSIYGSCFIESLQRDFNGVELAKLVWLVMN